MLPLPRCEDDKPCHSLVYIHSVSPDQMSACVGGQINGGHSVLYTRGCVKEAASFHLGSWPGLHFCFNILKNATLNISWAWEVGNCRKCNNWPVTSSTDPFDLNLEKKLCWLLPGSSKRTYNLLFLVVDPKHRSVLTRRFLGEKNSSR